MLSCAAVMLFATSCSEKKAPVQAAPQEEEGPDSVTLQVMDSIAGDYKSGDDSKVISLKKDGTATSKGPDEIHKWAIPGGAQLGAEQYSVILYKKGLENDVPVNAVISSDEAGAKLTLKNEVLRIRK